MRVGKIIRDTKISGIVALVLCLMSCAKDETAYHQFPQAPQPFDDIKPALEKMIVLEQCAICLINVSIYQTACHDRFANEDEDVKISHIQSCEEGSNYPSPTSCNEVCANY